MGGVVRKSCSFTYFPQTLYLTLLKCYNCMHAALGGYQRQTWLESYAFWQPFTHTCLRHCTLPAWLESLVFWHMFLKHFKWLLKFHDSMYAAMGGYQKWAWLESYTFWQIFTPTFLRHCTFYNSAATVSTLQMAAWLESHAFWRIFLRHFTWLLKCHSCIYAALGRQYSKQVLSCAQSRTTGGRQ